MPNALFSIDWQLPFIYFDYMMSYYVVVGLFRLNLAQGECGLAEHLFLKVSLKVLFLFCSLNSTDCLICFYEARFLFVDLLFNIKMSLD